MHTCIRSLSAGEPTNARAQSLDKTASRARPNQDPVCNSRLGVRCESEMKTYLCQLPPSNLPLMELRPKAKKMKIRSMEEKHIKEVRVYWRRRSICTVSSDLELWWRQSQCLMFNLYTLFKSRASSTLTLSSPLLSNPLSCKNKAQDKPK